MKRDRAFRIGDFAKMSGVTIRALRHYDRLGLLKPTRHPGSGYRAYAESDLGRLEQILMLKFFGVPLRQMGDLLRPGASLPAVLRRQRIALAAKRRRLDGAIGAIEESLAALEAGGKPPWSLIRTIIKEIEMENNGEWAMKYYSKEAKAKVEARRQLWSPELQEEVSKAWADLFRDIEACLDQDPASAEAQALAVRWRKLVEAFTGGDQEIQKGLNAMYSDQANWPAARRREFGVRPEAREFMAKVLKAAQ